MNMTGEQYEDLIILTSAHFLCDSLPPDWRDMPDEEFNEWMEMNVWEPFQHHPPAFVLDAILAAANATRDWIEVRL